jgi:transcriptional regulator with XRE-family HTH domain
MATMDRARDRGDRHARKLAAMVAQELRETRLSAGVSQAQVAQVAGLPQSRVSRTERIDGPAPRLDELARHCAVLGLSLSLRMYPEASSVRDAGQLRLLERLRAVVSSEFRWRTEVLVAGHGDLRAWDAFLDGPAEVAIDAETRLHDIQALQRRTELKLRDSGVACVVLAVAGTEHNRAVLKEHRAALASTLPLDTREVLAALRSGRAPAASGIVLL